MTEELARAFRFPGGAGLRERAATGRLNSAYILVAPPDAPILSALCAAVVCSAASGRPCGVCAHCRKALAGTHPDVRRVARDKDKRFYAVSTLREARADAFVTPNEAARKVTVIQEADAMSPAAQNVLLKVLEDPPAGAVFLLQCANAGRLLETVRSRCVTVSVPGEAPENPQSALGQAYVDLSRAGDAVGMARLLYEKFEKLSRPEAGDFLAATRAQTIGALATASGGELSRLQATLERLERAGTYLDASVSVGHIAGLLLAGGAEMRLKID